jgi:hypothetical protein
VGVLERERDGLATLFSVSGSDLQWEYLRERERERERECEWEVYDAG